MQPVRKTRKLKRYRAEYTTGRYPLSTEIRISLKKTPVLLKIQIKLRVFRIIIMAVLKILMILTTNRVKVSQIRIQL